MKEIKILIRIEEEKISYILDKEFETLPNELMLIAALDLIKKHEIEKLSSKFSARREYGSSSK